MWNGYSYQSHGGFGFVENSMVIMEKFAYTHTRECSICKSKIYDAYYLNQYGGGNLYYLTQGKDGNYAEYCTKSDGTRITCDNPGTCTKCGGIYNFSHAASYMNIVEGKLGCFGCDSIWGTVKYNNEIDSSVPALNTMTIEIQLNEPYTIASFEYRRCHAYNSL